MVTQLEGKIAKFKEQDFGILANLKIGVSVSLDPMVYDIYDYKSREAIIGLLKDKIKEFEKLPNLDAAKQMIREIQAVIDDLQRIDS